MRRLAVFVVLGVLLSGCTVFRGEPTLAERIAATQRIVAEDEWYGFHRVQFEFDGELAWVVEPDDARAGRPWSWTMEWPTAFVKRTGALALLAAGYHHVTLCGGAFQPDGSFKAAHGNMNNARLARSRAFQRFLVERLGFAPKANLIGMSWGGFFSVRYAGTYPDQVARMYLDCPLLDFTTLANWKGWNLCSRYGVTEDYVGKDDPRQPVNMAASVAKGGVEIFLLYGGQDQTVPPGPNCERFVTAFKQAGGRIQIGVAQGQLPPGNFGHRAYGHHPHGLEIDEQQVFLDFFDNGIRE